MRQVVEGIRHVRVRRSYLPLPDRQRQLEQRPRLLVLALRVVEVCQVVEVVVNMYESSLMKSLLALAYSSSERVPDARAASIS